MQEWIIEIMNQYGYVGTALLIAIENIFPPIPSEAILTFGGFMTTYSKMNIWLVALSATIGSLIGAVVLYYIGMLLTPQRLGYIIDRFGHILRVKKQDIKMAEGWFNKHGSITVFFCRFIPIIRSLISIPAGMTHMKLGKFLLFTTLGTSIWNIVLVYLGAIAGNNWESIVGYFKTYSSVAVAVVVIVVVCLIFWFARKKKLAKNINKDE